VSKHRQSIWRQNSPNQILYSTYEYDNLPLLALNRLHSTDDLSDATTSDYVFLIMPHRCGGCPDIRTGSSPAIAQRHRACIISNMFLVDESVLFFLRHDVSACALGIMGRPGPSFGGVRRGKWRISLWPDCSGSDVLDRTPFKRKFDL
jgi:hypothetical protein